MPSLFTPSGQDSISSLLSWSASADAGGVNGPRATLFFPILPASLLFGNPKIHRVQQRSNGRLPEAERGGAISGRLGNPSRALAPSNSPADRHLSNGAVICPLDRERRELPTTHAAQCRGERADWLRAAVLCDHSVKSVKSGSCSRLQPLHQLQLVWFASTRWGSGVDYRRFLGGRGEGWWWWRGCIPGAGNPPRHRLRHPPRISAISRFAGRLTDRHRAHAQFQGNEEISSSKQEGRGLPVVPDLVGYLH
jgi:hypothetical protein